jgi:hypothetical protein
VFTGMSAMGEKPVLRVAKYRFQESLSVASTVLCASLPP